MGRFKHHIFWFEYLLFWFETKTLLMLKFLIFLGREILWRQLYCLTSAPIWSLRIGWHMAVYTRNWPITKPSFEQAARMAVIDCQPISCCRSIYIDQSGALNSIIKSLNAASILGKSILSIILYLFFWILSFILYMFQSVLWILILSSV